MSSSLARLNLVQRDDSLFARRQELAVKIGLRRSFCDYKRRSIAVCTDIGLRIVLWLERLGIYASRVFVSFSTS